MIKIKSFHFLDKKKKKTKGNSGHIGLQKRGGGVGGRKQVIDGDKNRAPFVEIRRQGLRRIEAQRLHRFQGSSVCNEKCELASTDDLALRARLLLARTQFVNQRIRSRVPLLRIGLHDLNGAAAAEGGG